MCKEGIVLVQEEEINWQASLPAVLKNKEKIGKFVMENKEARFSIEAKGYIRQVSAELLLNELHFTNVVEKMSIYCSSKAAEPFRKYLLDKGIIPDLKINDWEKSVRAVLQLEDFNVWLNYAKGESLKYYD